MCLAIREMIKEGEARGEAREAKTIVIMGMEFGLEKEDILTRLKKSLSIRLKYETCLTGK